MSKVQYSLGYDAAHDAGLARCYDWRAFDSWRQSQRDERQFSKVRQLLEKCLDSMDNVPTCLGFIVVKEYVRRTVPFDFVWRVEFDSDVGVALYFRYVHNALEKRLSDADLSILLSMLEAIDWKYERSCTDSHYEAVSIPPAAFMAAEELDPFERARQQIFMKRVSEETVKRRPR